MERLDTEVNRANLLSDALRNKVAVLSEKVKSITEAQNLSSQVSEHMLK
jgi:hypothetical protein